MSKNMKLIMEDWRGYVNEEPAAVLQTVGDLRQALKKTKMAKRGGQAKELAKDAAVNALIGLIPGAGTAKSIFDIAKSVYSLPDEKKTNTALDALNVDDQISKIVDDAIENDFLNHADDDFERLPDETPLEQIDMTQRLADFIAKKFDRRSVSKPEGE